MRLASRFAAITIASAILFACAQPKRVHVEYDQRLPKIRTIGVLTPDITYYDLTLGGSREKNDAWSQQANQNVVQAVKAVLSRRGYTVKIIAREGELKQSLEEIDGLFTSIAWSYRTYVLAPRKIDVFPHKAETFDYSVGPIDDVLNANQVDALVLADGGSGGNSAFMQGYTVVLIALVDRTGALLWYEPYAQPVSHFEKDIRDSARVQTIVESMFEKMPAANK